MRTSARALFALALLFALAPPGAAAQSGDFPIAGGRFFTQTGGYEVSNAEGVRFWDAFQALGGVEAVGYPVSRRFAHGGFVTQAMQKAVFQWRPDTRSVSFVNVFDDLSRSGRDDWLLAARSTPRPLPPGWDGASDWPTVVRARTALLDVRPAMRRRYDAAPDALLRYGLPTSAVEDMGSHYAARLQRAVIQEWKVDVPWARAGETTVANGGDIMKEAGLMPPQAVEPQAAPASGALDPSGLGAGVDARVTLDLASVRRAPSDGSSEVARVFRNVQVEVAGQPAGGWVPVRLWNALAGWLPTAALTAEPYPARDARPGSPYRRPIPPQPVPSVSLPIDAPATVAAPATLLDAPNGVGFGALPAGAPTRLIGYLTDGGRTWFAVPGGWLPAQSVSALARDPLAPTAAGRPIAAPVAGKGMWATYDLLDRASPEAIVATMRANGLTHLYLQVGRSNLGFYGGPGLDRLLPVAHAGGVAVVAWVYPFLKDTTADVNLTIQAARYTTPDGHRPDALAADVEENMGAEEVHAYGQLVRAMLGDDYPLVVATYPPDSAIGRTYPFATVARTWNVIAPMDYYHRPGRAYPPEEAHAYVLRSIQLIRERAGRPVAVAPIGQAYGMQWPNETGPTNPDGDETRAMLRAARDGGAVGISFFEWAHATAPQWREIGAFPW